MKRIGIISYNINCNFTNYGSALQSWSLCQAIDKLEHELGFQCVLVDYCPSVLEDCDPLNPFKRMWDTDKESRLMVELTMPAIHDNYKKFGSFYTQKFRRSKKKYFDSNFNDIVADENIMSFVCGSDTIFCIDEFKGFVEGYYANFDCMKGNSIAYAASFGDPHFTQETLAILNERLQNFKAIGLRENQMLEYVQNNTSIPSQRVVDPTLLLKASDFEEITDSPSVTGKYLLLYSRRYNKNMEDFAIKLAKEKNLEIVEISLRATNAQKGHRMMYHAGVEEFLSLVKNAECIITNSFHGIIMSVQFRKLFYGFSREQCDNKTQELTTLLKLNERMLVTGYENISDSIDYNKVHQIIEEQRNNSLLFLKKGLQLLIRQ